MEHVFCSVCSKDMTDEDDTSIIGTSLTFSAIPGSPKIAFMEKQVAPYKLNKQYYICWGCWLRSLGVKPDSVGQF